MTEVVAGVHRLGSRLVNWYLVEENGRFAVVDAGLPRQGDQLGDALAALGATLDRVDAVVLTHGHTDHVGSAEPLRSQTGGRVRVLVHEADANLVRTGKQGKAERSVAPYLRHAAAWRLLAHFTAQGGARVQRPADVTTFQAGATLDVPGSPRVIHTPGHTHGHCALHFAGHRALVVGDALCTRNPLTGREGPQVMPAAFAQSAEQQLRSLDPLETVEADVVLAGHGDPWREGVAAAVERARAVGPT